MHYISHRMSKEKPRFGFLYAFEALEEPHIIINLLEIQNLTLL